MGRTLRHAAAAPLLGLVWLAALPMALVYYARERLADHRLAETHRHAA